MISDWVISDVIWSHEHAYFESYEVRLGLVPVTPAAGRATTGTGAAESSR